MGSGYGYEIVSRLPLRRLSAAPGPRGRVEIERGAESLLDRHAELTGWHERQGPDGEDLVVGRTSSGLIMWCERSGAFDIDPRAGRIRVAGARLDDTWEHRLWTTILPLLLGERGDLALHASAVVAEDRGVLFCGHSGRGKSTMALTAARRGRRVLGEDGIVLEAAESHALAWPGPRGVRVDDAVAAGGARPPPPIASNGRPRRRLHILAPDAGADGPVPVGAVCVLGERGAELELDRLPPLDALGALARSTIHAGGPASLRPAFGLLARLVERVPVYRVSMPNGIAAAGEAFDALLCEIDADVGSNAGRS